MNKRIPLQSIIHAAGLCLSAASVGCIIYFSLTVAANVPQWHWIPFADKGSHMAAYALLGFSLFLAFLEIPGSGRQRRKHRAHSVLHLTSWSGRAIIFALCVGSVLGGAMELIQPVFGRTRDWLDFAADFMGLAVGIAVALILLKLIGGYFSTRPWLYDPNWKVEDDVFR